MVRAMEANSSDRVRIKTAIKALVSHPGIKQNLDRLRRWLPMGAGILIVGGAIRNIIIELIHGNAPKTNDIDLIISGIAGDYPLGDRLAGLNFRHTELGGLRWHLAETNYSFDICLLPNFIMISIDLTVNAVIYDVDHHILLERHSISAIENRMIGFNTHLMLNKLLLVYRVLLIRHKTGFSLSEPVYCFIKDQVDIDTLYRLKRLLEAKQGGTAAKMILQDYDRICSFRNYNDYSASSPSG